MSFGQNEKDAMFLVLG